MTRPNEQVFTASPFAEVALDGPSTDEQKQAAERYIRRNTEDPEMVLSALGLAP